MKAILCRYCGHHYFPTSVEAECMEDGKQHVNICAECYDEFNLIPYVK